MRQFKWVSASASAESFQTAPEHPALEIESDETGVQPAGKLGLARALRL